MAEHKMREIVKYEEDKDRGCIGLDRTDMSWHKIKGVISHTPKSQSIRQV